ncbi:hypothetical protein [Streptococcus parauberis]|uniref:hypothetical protein n=1 Tax=Streptococcus parauberis TaxID=1348 RepID=UPI003788AD52
MDMEDYEKQEELKRANQLFSESNNLQKRQLDQQEQLSYQQKKHHDEIIREQRWNAEQKRIEKFEKEMDDKIYGLKVEIAKSKDWEVKSGLQVLLDEELTKKDAYYRQKSIKEEADTQEEQKRVAEYKKEIKKAKLVSLIKKIIFTIIIGIVALIALLWYFSGSNQDNTKNTFGESNITKKKNSDAEKQSTVKSSSQSSTSKTKKSDDKVSNAVTTKTNFQVEVTKNQIDVRNSPDINSQIISTCQLGVYTIVETLEADGYNWGKLESNEGWINLASTSRISESEVKDAVSTTTEWEKSYSYYYVPSNTSTLMMAGFKLEAFGYVTLYRSGAEIMASNSGNPVKGSYTIEKYSSSEQVTSYVINQKTIVNGDAPETKLVSPNIILKIHVPVSELKKADSNMSQDEDKVYYGYISNLGQHILTDGNSPMPQVFFNRGE